MAKEAKLKWLRRVWPSLTQQQQGYINNLVVQFLKEPALVETAAETANEPEPDDVEVEMPVARPALSEWEPHFERIVRCLQPVLEPIDIESAVNVMLLQAEYRFDHLREVGLPDVMSLDHLGLYCLNEGWNDISLLRDLADVRQRLLE